MQKDIYRLSKTQDHPGTAPECEYIEKGAWIKLDRYIEGRIKMVKVISDFLEHQKKTIEYSVIYHQVTGTGLTVYR